MKNSSDRIQLVYINLNEFEQNLYSDYLEIFPEDERKPLKLIENNHNKGYTKIVKVLENGNLIGFMILNEMEEKGYAILDYFAILPKFRNKGFGTQAMKLLLEQEKHRKGIFVELEKIGLGNDEEDNVLREKRKDFYEKLGFQKLNFDLILFDVVYMPYIYSNIAVSEDLIMQDVLNIYQITIGEELEGNYEIMKNLRFEELNEKNLKSGSSAI